MGGRWVGEFRGGWTNTLHDHQTSDVAWCDNHWIPTTFGDVDVSGGEIILERRH